MTKNVLLSLAVGVSVLLTSCQKAQPTQEYSGIVPTLDFRKVIATPAPLIDVGDGGLLNEELCGPPCFFGMMPGLTQEDKVTEFLGDKVDLAWCDIRDNRSDGGDRGIRCGSLAFSFDDALRIEWIGFIPTNIITVKEVISKYGNPSGVFVIWEEDERGDVAYVWMNLFFDNMFTEIELQAQQESFYTVEPSSLVTGISYMSPEYYQKHHVGKNDEWIGFGKYPTSSP